MAKLKIMAKSKNRGFTPQKSKSDESSNYFKTKQKFLIGWNKYDRRDLPIKEKWAKNRRVLFLQSMFLMQSMASSASKFIMPFDWFCSSDFLIPLSKQIFWSWETIAHDKLKTEIKRQIAVKPIE